MIWRTLLFAAFGFVGYKLIRRKGQGTNAAYAPDQPHDDYRDIRDAGPAAMRDAPQRKWTETDEDLDESFPASDPPGGY